MKNTKLSLIAILLPALVFMGASLKVHATGGGTPSVDVCLINNLPADYKKGTYVKFQMSGNVTTYTWYGSSRTSNVTIWSGWYGRGQKRCKKFDKGAVVKLNYYAGNKDGTNFSYIESFVHGFNATAPSINKVFP